MTMSAAVPITISASAPPPPTAQGAPREKITVRNLDFFYGNSRALKSISVPLYANHVTAFIGPSGCGKSTLLRVLNRMYDLYPNQRATGEVTWKARIFSRPRRISICCAPASAWCSRSRRRSR